MTENTHDKRNWDSVRTIIQGGILAGLIWLIGNSFQQSKDIAVIKTNSDYTAKNADKVPDIILRVQKLEDKQVRNEERFGNLEALERAK